MSKASFRQFAANLLQPSASIPSDSPPVIVRPLLLNRFAVPVACAAIRFRNVGPYACIEEMFQHFAAVVAL
ncbi:MAG: hypothetical protein ACRD6B_11925, partial [Bryobacteraceae bacterium]